MQDTEVRPTLEDLAGTWNIDPSHSMVEFTAKHMMISTVRGRFDEVEGTFTITPDVSRSSARVTIKADSISTNNPDRDVHLRSPDFLEVEQHPELTFESAGVELLSEDEGTFRLLGTLTVRGVSGPVALEGQFEGFVPSDLWGNRRAAFSASTSISRKDFGLTWNRTLETGGVLVSDRVNIELQVTAVKAA
jgi:polyisoprenoid-binding protein YceI